jgi:hypothetical protein
MTPEQINRTIAEACGLPFDVCMCGDSEEGSSHSAPFGHGFSPMAEIPNYHEDLNAMHSAERMLEGTPTTFNRFCDYWDNLRAITCGTFDADIADDCKAMLHATAPQRAEAFLRTVGKWQEATPPTHTQTNPLTPTGRPRRLTPQ